MTNEQLREKLTEISTLKNRINDILMSIAHDSTVKIVDYEAAIQLYDYRSFLQCLMIFNGTLRITQDYDRYIATDTETGEIKFYFYFYSGEDD